MPQELARLSARLEKARSEIAVCTRSRKHIQAQMTVLEQQEARLGQQAAKARQIGREDLAQVALARQQAALSQRAELHDQVDQLLGEEARLTSEARRLQAKRARIYWFGLHGQDGEAFTRGGGAPGSRP